MVTCDRGGLAGPVVELVVRLSNGEAVYRTRLCAKRDTFLQPGDTIDCKTDGGRRRGLDVDGGGPGAPVLDVFCSRRRRSNVTSQGEGK